MTITDSSLDLNLKPHAERLGLLLHAIDNPHSKYVSLDSDERESIRAHVLEYAREHSIKPKNFGPKQKRERVRRRERTCTPDELPIADEFKELFAHGRWPRKPYCSDDLEAGVKIRSLRHAVKKAHIQANPPHLRVWSIFDIDRPGAATAWQDAGIAQPSWTTINPDNEHAHLAYGIQAPVLVDGLAARDAPLRYLCAIESMMREKLGADQGYSGLITKNPAHEQWETLIGPTEFYDLAELAAYLPGIEKYRPKGRVEEVGLGRNITLFDALRKWAYTGIRQYWGGGLQGWNAWLSATNSRALVYNADFKTPLGGREVWHIAKSVSKWTWRNFSAEGFSQWQAQAGKKGGVASGKARAAASEDKRASARLMAATGMSVRAIAEALGVGKSSVARWLI